MPLRSLDQEYPMLIATLRRALGAAVLIAWSLAASAQSDHSGMHRQEGAKARSYKVGSLVIEAPWSRATPGGAKVAGGYLRITNNGSEPDRLVGGTVAVSGKFELHEMSMQGDVARMRPLDRGLEIKPGQTVELKPGGNHHLMFVDLKQPLKQGETIKGTLVFEKAGRVAVEYAVRSIGARDGEPEHRH
jgi:periplasmic copper chaperone A